MFCKTKIYIDRDSLEIIAQDSTIADNYYKNVIEIFRRCAEVYIDLSDEELNEIKEPEDLNDTNDIFAFIETRNLPWPIAAKEHFDFFREDSSKVKVEGNIVYILNISKDDSERIRQSLGVWMLSVNEMSDDVFRYVFNKHLNVKEIPGPSTNGWCNLLKDEVPLLPPSNSFVLSDSNLLANDVLDENKAKHYRGLENVKDLLSVILPQSMSIPFYILILCPGRSDQVGKMKKIISKWVEEVKGCRSYPIIIEFLTTSKTLHARDLYANNYRIELDRGFYVFEPWSNKVHTDDMSFNKVDIKSYLSSPFDRGDSVLDIANTELVKIRTKYMKFISQTGDPISQYPISEEFYSKNRILF